MSQERPTPVPNTAPPGAAIVLPRPNLGPEPWSGPEPGPVPSPAGWLLGALVAISILSWAGRRLVRRRAARRAAARRTDPFAAEVESATPGRRLIASSAAIRSALIAEFGPTWGSRTTEEIARDAAVADRLGPEVAAALAAYLQRVDRAKFADEEPDDVDAALADARDLLSRFPRARTAGRAKS